MTAWRRSCPIFSPMRSADGLIDALLQLAKAKKKILVIVSEGADDRLLALLKAERRDDFIDLLDELARLGEGPEGIAHPPHPVMRDDAIFAGRVIEQAVDRGLMRLDGREDHRPAEIREVVSDDDEIEASRALIEPIAAVNRGLNLPIFILDERAKGLDHRLIALDKEDARLEVDHRGDGDLIVDVPGEREHRVEGVV